ncbi:MAG: methyltransferase domain-containing protein [Deltaproteobacteria bacterium]|nr:methyltransferase domain-containing protein [Deltaproteobacteria bacterium]
MRAMDPTAYYDAFSRSYDRRRRVGYHALVDDLEAELVARFAPRGLVLDAGCGTGQILERLGRAGIRACGVDLSSGMLRQARSRAPLLVRGDLVALPFGDGRFDAVCCFKVLAHVPEVGRALAELGRLVRPGGFLIAEFYNPHSVRGALWRLKRPGRIAAGVDERDIHLRFDAPAAARQLLPPGFEPVTARGIRLLTPFAQALRLPLVGPLLARAERVLADGTLAGLGSFYCLVAQREIR